jgi:hydrogenase maturation protein HypF
VTDGVAPAPAGERARIRVEGIVQGVGFRPFVHALATRLGLAGVVGNDAQGVFAEVEGDAGAVAAFLEALEREAPPLAVIDAVRAEPMAPTGDQAFVIVPSEGAGVRSVLVSPDAATCEDCLLELFDPTDRRYRYPFVNCTNCGPRFTIIRDVPYDRPFTTMAGFEMCAECAREYRDPSDRRFHAQPVCCPACGPSLRLVGADGGEMDGDPIEGTAELLHDGKVVAVKGLGGYHLAAVASSEPAVSTLRSRKHREDKAFAVMVRDLDAIRHLCEVSEGEAAALLTARRPIVLLRRLPAANVARSTAPANRYLGVMLPYTPLHHLLLAQVAAPIVLTSGNVSDEPIAYLDDEARERLRGIADAFLLHDRPIHVRTDDSVVRVVEDRERPIRRARGYVPRPIRLPWAFPRDALACGADLKNTFCVAKDRHAFVSHHIGDLENYETLRSFTEGIDHFLRLFDVTPAVVAHDLHPEYQSTKYALDLREVDLVGVQHHHAHIASCLADNDEEGPVIGVAFDGLGFGPDGTIWGGEFLVASLSAFERVANLAPVPMPGGEAAIREPWRMAAAYLDAAFDGHPPEDLDVIRRNQDRWRDVVEVARAGSSSPLTSSAGRLFDAVAAILGVRDGINYEGQAAVELEQLADPSEEAGYRAAEDPRGVRGTDLVRAVVDDLAVGVEPAVVSARFHNGLAAAVVRTCERIRDERHLATVALSGGVFQNLLLLGRTGSLLRRRGFRVLLHSRVPPNDGGISLGQAAVAGALDRARVGS